MNSGLLRGASRERRNEQGAVVILMALAMMMLLIIAGMLLDFGLARMDRQQNKAVADAAATAGAVALGEDNISLAGVCGAIEFLKVNKPPLQNLQFLSGSVNCSTDTIGNEDPCQQDVTPKYDVTMTAPGYIVQITSPYQLPALTDQEPYASSNKDKGSASGCDQVRVSIRQARKPGLGSLATSSDLVTQVGSVARGINNPDEELAAVAVVLAQHDCNAIKVSGGGAFFRVHPAPILNDVQQPGFIHSDSDAGASSCGGTTAGKVLVGGHAGGIKAFQSDDGVAGIVRTRAPLRKMVDSTTNVVAEGGTPQYGPLVTRKPVDSRYRAAVQAALSSSPTLTSIPALSWTSYNLCKTGGKKGAGVDDGPWSWANPGPLRIYACNSGTPQAFTLSDPGTSTKCVAQVCTVNATGPVEFDMTSLTIPIGWTLVIKQATDVYFSGPVTVAGTLTVSGATNVYVAGAVDVSGTMTVPTADGLNFRGPLSVGGSLKISNPSDLYVNGAISVSGTLEVGTRLLVGTTYNCTNSKNVRLRMASGTLSVTSAGKLMLCNTTVFNLSGVPSATTTDTIGCVPTVTGENPEDGSSSCTGGRFDFNGTVFWHAPNRVTDRVSKAADGVEDLAYWSETKSLGSVPGAQTMNGSAANLDMTGLFFTPKSLVKFSGSVTATLTDAQFIAYQLLIDSSVIDMTPNYYDMVLLPGSRASELMR